MRSTRKTREDSMGRSRSGAVCTIPCGTPSRRSDRHPTAERFVIAMQVIALLFTTLAAAADAGGQAASPADEAAFKAVDPMSAGDGMRPAVGTDQPRVARTRRGHVRTLGAPSARHFPVPSVIPGDPRANARRFLLKNRAEFGMTNEAFDVTPGRTRSREGRTYVRSGQSYSDIEVFGAGTVTQLNEADGVEYVSADLLTDDDTPEVDGILSVPPAVTPSEAEGLAVAVLTAANRGREFHAEPATRKIYLPSIVGNTGAPRLVWQTKVASVPDADIAEMVLVDAHSGEIVLHYSLVKDALSRRIYDAQNTKSTAILARKEGGSRSWIVPDVDLAYDYIGDACNFFLMHAGRDGLDGMGLTPRVYVRYGPRGEFEAFWSAAGFMVFGEACVADDVVGHEYGHGLAQYEADFLYLNESGAIDESFADIWGELIDQTNGRGDDSTDVKWLIGEDLIPPWSFTDKRLALRNMKDPAQSPYCQPDRKGSVYWHDWRTSPSDNGGVHTNCGVGNKLCYLLTDGGTFNGYSISGMGVEKVADLYYETLANLLTSAADYEDLYFALLRAAENLGWTWSEKQNIENACRAVETAVFVPQSNVSVEQDQVHSQQ